MKAIKIILSNPKKFWFPIAICEYSLIIGIIVIFNLSWLILIPFIIISGSEVYKIYIK